MNFRRIVQRGLANYLGELWYREGLPSDVFRRLVVRKESETPLDRFSGDYEELMTYADFRDLADIIAGNDALRDRLSVLQPQDGGRLLDRLEELEQLRRSSSSNGGFSDEDEEKLGRYFTEFRDAIKGRKKSPRDSGDPPAQKAVTSEPVEEIDKPESEPTVDDEPWFEAVDSGPVAPPEPEHEGETLESIFESDMTPEPVSTPRPGRLVVKVSSGGLKSSESSSSSRPRHDIGAKETPVTEVSMRGRPTDSRDRGPVEEAEGLERAIRDKDNAAILKTLHVEVTEVADGMLRREPKQGHPAWGHVQNRGWFEDHRDHFDLAPLEVFYDLADSFLDAFSSGAKSSELKAMLADAGFSKLLLEMREMFLSSRAKA